MIAGYGLGAEITDAGAPGEVYVLNDGGEVDLDLGNYERYLDVTLSRDNNITTGKIYREVIEKERKGEYLGKTVQVSTQRSISASVSLKTRR